MIIVALQGFPPRETHKIHVDKHKWMCLAMVWRGKLASCGFSQKASFTCWEGAFAVRFNVIYYERGLGEVTSVCMQCCMRTFVVMALVWADTGAMIPIAVSISIHFKKCVSFCEVYVILGEGCLKALLASFCNCVTLCVTPHRNSNMICNSRNGAKKNPIRN